MSHKKLAHLLVGTINQIPLGPVVQSRVKLIQDKPQFLTPFCSQMVWIPEIFIPFFILTLVAFKYTLGICRENFFGIRETGTSVKF